MATSVIFVHGINGHRIWSWTSGAPDPSVRKGTVSIASSNEVPQHREDTATLVLVDAIHGDNSVGSHASDNSALGHAEDVVLTNPIPATDQLNYLGGPVEKEGGGEVRGDNREGGEARKEEKGVMWARDFLPAKLPKARILTYGYKCATADSTGLQLMSRSWIKQSARDLLNQLVAGGVRIGPEKHTNGPEGKEGQQNVDDGEGCGSEASVADNGKDGAAGTIEQEAQQDTEDTAGGTDIHARSVDENDSRDEEEGGTESNDSENEGEGEGGEGTETTGKVTWPPCTWFRDRLHFGGVMLLVEGLYLHQFSTAFTLCRSRNHSSLFVTTLVG